MDVARSFGFSDAEIRRIRDGAIISKASKEASDKELAGVVAIFVKKPLAMVAEFDIRGEHGEIGSKRSNVL